MSDSNPENNAQGRFAARVMIVLVLLVFVVAVSAVFCLSASQEREVVNVVEDNRAAARIKELSELNKAQQDLVTQAEVVDQAKNLVRIPVKEGMKLVLPVLKEKKEGPSKILVPGSPTQLKQSQAAAATAAAAKAKEGKADKAPEKQDGAETDKKAPESKVSEEK
ncbi:MAG: hypothetical protein GXP30_12905 [Verrucomicrobia bacterium]|nr:hypothetical protein [Verrucomicrobiota bacterium]